MPEIIQGIPLPLFDRLTLGSSDEAAGALLDSMDGMQASIRRDLHRLLNTRSNLGVERYLEQELTVVDFGIPEVTVFSARNGEDRHRLEKVLKKGIHAFEPRLINLSVRVLESERRNSRLDVLIAADACLHSEQQRMEFQIELDGTQDAQGEAEHVSF